METAMLARIGVTPSLILVSAGLFCPVARAESQADLWETVRAAHQATVQSIRTFHCRCVISGTAYPSGEWSGEYWRSGNMVRSKDRSGNGMSTDRLLREGQALGVSRSPSWNGGRPMAAIAEADRTPSFNAWFCALLAFNVKDGWGLELERLCSRPYSLNAAKRVQENGRTLVYADLTHGDFRHELWFDPQVNYLVTKKVVHLTLRQRSYSCVSTTEVKRFREVTPSMYFPELLETEHNENGQQSRDTATLTDLSINQPLPSDLWEFRFPTNTEVANHIDGIVYKVNRHGKLGEPARDRAGKIKRVIVGDVSGPRLVQSSAAPIPWIWWLVPASLLVLAIAMTIWGFRRWRALRAMA